MAIIAFRELEIVKLFLLLFVLPHLRGHHFHNRHLPECSGFSNIYDGGETVLVANVFLKALPSSLSQSSHFCSITDLQAWVFHPLANLDLDYSFSRLLSDCCDHYRSWGISENLFGLRVVKNVVDSHWHYNRYWNDTEAEPASLPLSMSSTPTLLAIYTGL